MEPLVKPFRALRFDLGRVGPLDDLISPPYDVISPERLERLVAASPYNVIRLIRPHEPDLAGRRLRDWTREGILVREDRPALWQLEEEYVGPDGIRRTRRGLVARMRLEPYERGIVRPHERIFPAQSDARLALLRATRTKLSPVLVLHGGEPSPSPARPPDLEATLEGTTTRLWRIDDPEQVAALVATVRGPLVIADGHHRYDAALRLHQEEGTEETGWVLSALVSHADPGLMIFPTHRVVEGAVPALNGRFRVSEVEGGPEAALALLGELERDRPAFVLVRRGAVSLVEARERAASAIERLDVSAVDRLALEGVSFTPFASEAALAVENGEASAALLVRAPTVADVEQVARAGLTMPEKSTFFYPKLATGLLFSPLDE